MKHLKTYEEVYCPAEHSLDWLHKDDDTPYRNPKIGDYVIVNFSDTLKRKSYTDFMKTHVGKIIEIKKGFDPLYKVDFEEILPEFDFSVWTFRGDNITAFSSDKEELETILATNKYNI